MLIHENIALHNVVETEPAPGGGLALRRFPRSVREALSPLGRMVSADSAGIEVRFVTDAPAFRISLGGFPSFLPPHEEHGLEVVVMCGAIVHSIHRLEAGRVNHLHISQPAGLPASLPKARGFASSVWRIAMGRCTDVFHGLETYGFGHRPPVADELPEKRWLAYGSSITHGASPGLHHNTYIYHAARIAGLDVLNLGLSGSCLCEPEMAAYLANREDYQIATLEVGVNMRATFTPQDFRERVSRLLDGVCRPEAGRKVFLITVYPNISLPNLDEAQRAFSTILRELHASGRWPGLGLVEGGSVLDDPGDLTTDLIHPSDYGHARMGQLLGAQLRSARP